jgi:serine/threonine-protein kinase
MAQCRTNIFETGNVIQEKWVILELIGKGAMGEIYLAHQLNLKRDVALKVVSEEWLEDIDDDPEEVETAFQRFRREVQAMARIRHPNVLQVFDHGSSVIKKDDGDSPIEFIVMEYIPGDTLRFTMSEEGFYPEPELLQDWLEEYFLPVLDGVEAIHALDVVHRDLKPENILMDGMTPKIADFGLARSSRLKPVTQSMDVKGTAHYMSPEHFFDFRKADRCADIYSLGKILFEAIDGKIGEGILPFKTASLQEAETPFFQSMDRIIQKATAENKGDRFESIDQLRRAILEAIRKFKFDKEAALTAGPARTPAWHQPRWIWSGVMLAIIAVTAMTIWHLAGNPGGTPEVLDTSPENSKNLIQRNLSEMSAIEIAESDTPKQSILAEDGASMRFVPAGVVSVYKGVESPSKRTVKVNPFYMDETLVTNHQYVEFLNQNLSRIRVERGVVNVEDDIWLLLGEVKPDYVPIVFQNGKFKVNKVAYASFPVLRITAYGASAYARFYNRRLPTYTEWLHVLGATDARIEASVPKDAFDQQEVNMESMHGKMHTPKTGDDAMPKSPETPLSSVINHHPNKYGIRGLNQNIKEWGLLLYPATSRDKIRDADFVVLPTTLQRHPWEAFEGVGFRCVREVKMRAK